MSFCNANGAPHNCARPVGQQSRHCFGSIEDVAKALAAGTIGKFDLVFTDEGTVCWIDESGNIVQDVGHAVSVYHAKDSFPSTGSESILYVDSTTSLVYYWDGTDYRSVKAVATYDDTPLRELIDGKVDKVAGKGLSTNDFTGAYKSAIDNLTNAGIDGVSYATSSDIDSLFP